MKMAHRGICVVNKHYMEGRMNKAVQGVIGLGLLCMSAAPVMAATDISKLPVVTQELVAPPFLPKHDQYASLGAEYVQRSANLVRTSSLAISSHSALS